MTNTNILEGMQCPACKSDGPFKIQAKSMFTVYDDGTDDYGDVDWYDDSYCMCSDCDHSATVKDFGIKESEAAA